MTSENGQTTAVATEEPGTAIVPATPQAIFKTDDPMEIMQETTKVAAALKEFIGTQGLVSKISGRDYIVVEGWQMLGMMLGVTPGKVTTRAVEDGWEAAVELHDRTGRVVGAGEAVCLATEKTWKSRDDYARKSMAQTRAIGKAFRNTFGFIAKAAGYEATPAEEMPGETTAEAEPVAAAPKLTAPQRKGVIKAIEAADQPVDLVLRAVGVDAPEELTEAHWPQIERLIWPEGKPS
jgi:hypothetical protein